MPRVSTKRDEVYEYIRSFLDENGYAPSVREICAATELSSTASAYYHLQALAREGKIRVDESKKRAISLPDERKRGHIPLLGVVTAGVPILAVENVEGYLPWDGDEDCFALRVRGESMLGAGILPDDRVIVHPQQSADSGDIVVALLEDEATVKRLRRTRGEVWLMPENPAFEPIDGRFAQILGRVVGVVREY